MVSGAGHARSRRHAGAVSRAYLHAVPNSPGHDSGLLPARLPAQRRRAVARRSFGDARARHGAGAVAGEGTRRRSRRLQRAVQRLQRAARARLAHPHRSLDRTLAQGVAVLRARRQERAAGARSALRRRAAPRPPGERLARRLAPHATCTANPDRPGAMSSRSVSSGIA